VGVSQIIPDRVSDLFGVAPSKVMQVGDAARAGESWIQMLRIVAPGLGNTLSAIESDTVRSRFDRGRAVARLDTSDRVTKGIGFRTTRESLETDVSRLTAQERQNRRATQQATVDAIINIIDEEARKPAGEKSFDKAMVEITERLADATKEGVNITPKMIEEELTRKNLTRSQRAILNADRIALPDTVRRAQQIEQLEAR
jgi:hypothetical protein